MTPDLHTYVSPLGVVITVPSSDIGPNESFGLDEVGELFIGSGLVPQDDPGPCCDTDDAEGDEVVSRPLSLGVPCITSTIEITHVIWRRTLINRFD